MAELPEPCLGRRRSSLFLEERGQLPGEPQDMRAFFLFFPIFILALLFAFCGGPLFVADLLTPRFGGAGFLAAIAPLMIALVGASSFMELDPIGTGRHLRFGGRAVVVGLTGMIITGLMNAFALWR